jgi:hypothetical protein
MQVALGVLNENEQDNQEVRKGRFGSVLIAYGFQT